jgi:hypothetical protein
MVYIYLTVLCVHGWQRAFYLFGNCFGLFFHEFVLAGPTEQLWKDSVMVLDAVLFHYLGKEKSRKLEACWSCMGREEELKWRWKSLVQLFHKRQILVGSLILVLFGNLVCERNPGKRRAYLVLKAPTQCGSWEGYF